jgi:hypothetical protein
MNISQGLPPFHLIQDTSKVLLTSFGGLPLVMEAFRSLGLAQSIEKHLTLHQREGKYQEADYIEAFISVFAAGGECVDDFEILRQDEGLKKLGLRVPSPEAARCFLNVCHEEELLQGRLPHQAFIPEETEALKRLAAVQRDLIKKATLKEHPWKATIDLDATVIDSHKQQAYWTYLQEKGYQPLVAYWAEQDMILADQFQDGNVPAGMDLLPILKRAILVLPPTVRLVRVRSDSAAYVHELLDWCREEIPGRPRIEFAISADVTEELRGAIQAVAGESWKPLRKVTDQGLIVGRKEWAEVEFVPSKSSRKHRDAARSVLGDSYPASSGRTLSGWDALSLLCRRHEYLELEWGEVVAVAEGTLWDGRKGP